MSKEFSKISNKGGVLTTSGIRVELIASKTVKLTYPSGLTEVIKAPVDKGDKFSLKEYLAITTTRLVIPDIFPEATGVDQAGYQVEREREIVNLPGAEEGDYRSALRWAGAVLQRSGISAERVAEIHMQELPAEVKASKELGTISGDMMQMYQLRLQRVIAGIYPGAYASIERSRRKKIPDW